MFGGRSARGRSPIGVDLGPDGIRLIQLEHSIDAAAARWSVAAAAMRPAPDTPPSDGAEHAHYLAQTLRAMLAEDDFRGRACVSCLPVGLVHFKNLRLPPMPGEELTKAVEWEATDRMSFERGQMELQYFDAGVVRQGDESRQEVILMAAATADVEAHVGILTRCGLDPLAVDVAPAALARSLARGMSTHAATTEETSTPARVIVELGRNATQVVIVRQGRIVFCKIIDVGGATIEQEIAQRLHLASDEVRLRRQRMRDEAVEDKPFIDALTAATAELSRELQLCLRYYSVTFRGVRPDRIALVGHESNDVVLARLMSEQSGFTLEPVSPFHAMNSSRLESVAAGTCPGQWAVATGLALRTSDPQATYGDDRMEAAA